MIPTAPPSTSTKRKEKNRPCKRGSLDSFVINSANTFHKSFKRKFDDKSEPQSSSRVRSLYLPLHCSDCLIFNVGVELLAQCISFLDPSEAFIFLSMPLSKTWYCTFIAPQDLWKILFVSGPFYATEKSCSSIVNYRSMYTFLVQGKNCLDKIKEAAKSSTQNTSIRKSNLNQIEVAAESTAKIAKENKIYGNRIGIPVNKIYKDLQDSVCKEIDCSISAVKNWSAAFPGVLGIQVMCLETLIQILVDNSKRGIALKLGIKNLVLHQMRNFPSAIQLQIAGMHALVLLSSSGECSRGMIFQKAMQNSVESPNNSQDIVQLVINNMKCFAAHARLQAMGCWALVNISLDEMQRTKILSQGGLKIITDAMVQHCLHSELQFRALYALINLVIPCENKTLGELHKRIIDKNLGLLVTLTVTAMRNFDTVESIINRSCLLLHNLSLDDSYLRTIMWEPFCYQTLHSSSFAYRNNTLLHQCAKSILNRITNLLSNEYLQENFRPFLNYNNNQSMEELNSW